MPWIKASIRASRRETSYRETFRRHRKLLCTPMVLGALAAALFLFGMGRTYTSTASLWVDTAAPLPSSIGAGGYCCCPSRQRPPRRRS